MQTSILLQRLTIQAVVWGILLFVAFGCMRSEQNNLGKIESPDARSLISATIYDRGTISSSEGTIVNNKMTAWINQAGPVDVQFVAIPRTQSEETLNVMFAAESAPDLILEYMPQIKFNLLDRQLLRPIDDMIDHYSTYYKQLLQRYPELRIAGTGADGKLYQFGRINETIPQRGLFIRMDWLEKLKLPFPETTEQLYLTAKAFTEQDPDGNQRDDTYGIAMSYNSGQVIDEMFGVTYPDFIVQDGELIHGWDNIEAATEFKKKLYSEGLVDPLFFNDKNGSRAKRDFITGKTGIYMDQFNVPMAFYTDIYEPLKRNVPGAELTVIPYPQTPVGRYNPIFVNPIQMTAVVNANTSNPEAVMKYVDFAASERFMKTMYFGLEGVHSLQKEGQCPEMIDLEKWRSEFNYAMGDFAMLASPILSGRCYFGNEKLDEQDPMQREVKRMFELNSSYIQYDLQIPGPTHSEHMPQPPKEVQEILSETTRWVGANEGELWMKSVLTDNYSPAEARQEAEALWAAKGGAIVDEWYKHFYRNDRNSIILTEDIYRIFREQQRSLASKG